MPRSAIMITRSRKLSLKLVYQLTHKTMICRSKCRPLNRPSIGTNRCISSSSPATLAFAPEPCDERPVRLHGIVECENHALRGDPNVTGCAARERQGGYSRHELS